MRNPFPIVKRPLWTRAGAREKPGASGLTQTLPSCSENQVARLYLLPDPWLLSLFPASKLCLVPPLHRRREPCKQTCPQLFNSPEADLARVSYPL